VTTRAERDGVLFAAASRRGASSVVKYKCPGFEGQCWRGREEVARYPAHSFRTGDHIRPQSLLLEAVGTRRYSNTLAFSSEADPECMLTHY
jgi:hypothetical protein